MKKLNLVTVLSICFLIVGVVIFMLFGSASFLSSNTETENSTTQGNNVSVSTASGNTDFSENKTDINRESEKETQNVSTKPIDFSMKNSLFIGDSRTVGLMEYGGIEDADFFCTVGMSVYNIHKKPVSVNNVGKVTLTELLNNKKYDKIYIMLGINEIGYEFNSIVNKYTELIEFIETKQPDAVIFIQANLHVTKSRSDNDKVINNNAINRLNSELSKLADNKNKFYIDANPLFDDENGCLSADKSEDGAHILAKYYKEWGNWIIKQTALLTGEV